MNKKSKLKLLLKSLFVQFGQVQCDNGVTLLWNEDTELIVGYDVFVEKETESGETEYVAPEDGEYMSGETIFVIKDGKCVEIRKKGEEVPTEPANENLAEPTPEPTPEPTSEPTPEPSFDAQKAIEDLRAEYDAKFEELNSKYNAMKEQLDALLALPQDENAFSKESKNDNQKPIFKTKK